MLISGGPATIQPGGYLLLAASAPIAERWKNLLIPILVVSGFPALNNGGDIIVISDSQGSVIDSLEYEGSWSTKKGWSLERIHPGSPFSLENCGPSSHVDGGTPGARNALCPPEFDLALDSLQKTIDGFSVLVRNLGLASPSEASLECTCDSDNDGSFTSADITTTLRFDPPLPSLVLRLDISLPCAEAPLVRTVLHASRDAVAQNDTMLLRSVISVGRTRLVFNEIMAAPLAGKAEWIELYNRSPLPVSLQGCHLLGSLSSNGTRTSLSLPDGLPPVPSEGFFVIAADSSIYGDWPELAHETNAVTAVLQRSSLGLGNSGDEILLVDAMDSTIDSLVYSDGWHHPLVPSTTGRSLESLNPELQTRDASTWTTCPHPTGGTPGKRNAAYSETPLLGNDGECRIAISPNPFSPDGDGFEDHCMLSWRLPSSVSFMRLRIYDIEGRCIRTLLNSVAAGSTGSAVWDGLDEHGGRGRIGIYVVLAEALDASSNTVSAAKTTIVLATRL